MSEVKCYIPRVCIESLDDSTNKNIVVKFIYKKHEISLQLDSNFGDGNLSRGDIRVYTDSGEGRDVTDLIFPKFSNDSSIETLLKAVNWIDKH